MERKKARAFALLQREGIDLNYINGDATIVFHTVDNGKTWQTETTASQHHLDAFWASSPDDIYATGEAGTILHRRP